MSIGERVIADILKENHDRYILLDPSGWLSDPSFVDVCTEYNIRPITFGEPAEKSYSEVQELLSKKDKHETLVILVDSYEDAESWHEMLGLDWHMKNVQPSSIFPELDPEITKHLSPAQAANLLPRFSSGYKVLGPKRSAEALLEALFGMKVERLSDINYFLEFALMLHLRGDSLDKSWLQSILGRLPSIQGYEISPLDALTDIEAFTKLLEALIKNGKISREMWRIRLRQLAFGTTSPEASSISFSERLGLDPVVLKDRLMEMSWDGVSLIEWLDRSQALARLSLAEEFFEDPELSALRETTERAFHGSLIREYVKLQQTPRHYRPPMVHNILPFIQAHHKTDKIALIIVDCLSISFWLALRWTLGKRFSLEPAYESSTFAWIPSLTSVSRQSIFAAKIPADLGEFIKGTNKEQKWWEEFWLDKEFRKDAMRLIKEAETKEAEVKAAIEDQDIRRLGLIYNVIDNLVHSSTSTPSFKTERLLEIAGDWASNYFGPTIKELLRLGWVVYLTSDHGAQRMRRDIGIAREGVLTEKTGQRARIYSRQNFAAEAKLKGVQWDSKGTLPPDYVALLAPPGTGYGKSFGWGHGGASWEELIVPFVKFEGPRS